MRATPDDLAASRSNRKGPTPSLSRRRDLSADRPASRGPCAPHVPSYADAMATISGLQEMISTLESRIATLELLPDTVANVEERMEAIEGNAKNVDDHPWLNGKQMPQWERKEFGTNSKYCASGAGGYELILVTGSKAGLFKVHPALHLVSLLPGVLALLHAVWIYYGTW